jgi:hypothetical protein
MSRWLLASMIAAVGITWAAVAPAPACADEKEKKASQSDSSRGRDDDEANPEKRIDKAIQTYESRADQELDQTRKEVHRLRKELSEMTDLYFDMVVSLAELRAQLSVQAAEDNGSPGDDKANSESGSTSSGAEKERQRLRAMELNRELCQLQDNLRNAVQQRRNEIEQIVTALRNHRAQQKQAASDRERNKQQAPGSPD